MLLLNRFTKTFNSFIPQLLIHNSLSRYYVLFILIILFNLSFNLSLFGATTITICSSGCDETSIQTAYDNAAAGDTLELHENISENLYMMNAKACNITSASGQMYTWDGADNGTATLTIESYSTYNAWTVSNVIMDHSSSSGGYVVAFYKGGNGDNNPNVTFEDCILKRTSTSTTNARIMTGTGGAWNGTASTQITIRRTEIIGTSYTDGIWYQSGNNTHPYDLTNCILRGFTGTRRALYEDGTNVAMSMNLMNCTFFNNNEGYRVNGSANGNANAKITNCLFLSNTSDIANMNSTRKADVTYCAISGSGYGTGCQYNPTTAEVVDATAGNPDLHLSSTAPLSLDNGTNTGAPSDDFDGNARPYNTTTDIGAFEWSVTIAMTKSANTYIATIGDTITFCITYTNLMGTTQTFKVWDTLPANMSFVGCDSCSRDFFGDTTIVWWQVNSLADDDSGTVCFYATVDGLPFLKSDEKYYGYWGKRDTLVRCLIEHAIFLNLNS